VYYERDDPTDALIDTPVELWFLPAIVGGAATLLWIPSGLAWLGVIVLLQRRSRAHAG
jgi:hypothetical protein